MKPTKAEVHLVERARLSCDTQKKNPDKPRIEAFFTFDPFQRNAKIRHYYCKVYNSNIIHHVTNVRYQFGSTVLLSGEKLDFDRTVGV